MTELLNKITQGDCLEVMRDIPDGSVDLIVIDPPYNIGKDSRWDRWKCEDEYVEFMVHVFSECERVLNDKGSFYWFHNDFVQMARLQVELERRTKFIHRSLITVNKTDNNYIKDLFGTRNQFRNYLNLAEYCVYYTFKDAAIDAVHEKRMTVNNINDYKELVDKIRHDVRESGITKEDAADIFYKEGRFSSYQSARVRSTYQLMFTKGTYFEFMTESMYEYLRQFINWSYTYKELRSIYTKIREGVKEEADAILRKRKEEERYTFNKGDGVSNVWDYSFREDKRYGHPTQKPVKLIADIIEASSNAGDVVLDCFLGSGTTAVAAIKTNRQFIGIEKEPEYVEIGNRRIAEALAGKEAGA